MTDPDEIWMAFMESRDSGKVALRMRVIRAIPAGGGRVLMVVMEVVRGEIVGWTVFPKDRESAINALRQGELIFARESGP